MICVTYMPFSIKYQKIFWYIFITFSMLRICTQVYHFELYISMGCRKWIDFVVINIRGSVFKGMRNILLTWYFGWNPYLWQSRLLSYPRYSSSIHSQLAVAVQFSYKTFNRIMIKNNLQEFLYIYSDRKSVCLRRYLFCVFYRIMYRYVRQPSGQCH